MEEWGEFRNWTSPGIFKILNWTFWTAGGPDRSGDDEGKFLIDNHAAAYAN
jgi:hypothetical protein